MTTHALPVAECPACVASRRSVVDAFFLGFRAGFRTAVATQIENSGETPIVPAPQFCVAHDRTLIEAYADEVRMGMGMHRVGGADGCGQCP